jgi:hypothetical protein
VAKAPLIGGFGAEDSAQNAQERSINWMPEKINGKTEWRMRPTPGLRLFSTLPEYPIRGAFEASNGRVFVAAGRSLYEIFADATFIFIGELTGGATATYIDDNGFQLVVVNGNSGWTYSFDTSVLAPIISSGFFPSPMVVVFDGYAVMFRTGTGVYFYSDIYDATSYRPTDEGTTESNPDNIVAVVWDGSGPVVLGTKSLEFYWNTGNANLVFQRRPGAQLRYGCIAQNTALNVDDGVVWLGRDPNGQGNVYRVSGSQPTKLSSIFVDEAIQNVAGLDNSSAMAYEQSGAAYYCLNIPGSNTTLVYDLSTTFWHERRSFDARGNWGRWRVEKHVLAFGLHIGCDYENGNLYVIDPNHRTENGTIIRRERTFTPIYDANNLGIITFNSFALDINVGDTPVTAPGDDPAIFMLASNDGGKTFGEAREKTLGRSGEYRTKVKWRKCGSSRNRVFKAVTTAQTDVTIYGAFMDTSVSS